MYWKNLIRPALQKVEVYKIPTGEEVFPESNTNRIEEKLRDYNRCAATGLDVVLTACTPSIAVQIDNIDNLPKLWKSLTARYHTRDSDDACMIIKNNFEKCTLEEDGKVGEFFHRLGQLRQPLVGSPEEIDDQNFISKSSGYSRKFPGSR